MQLFPARELLVSIWIYTLGPLPKSKSGRMFLLTGTDKYTNLTQAVLLLRIDAYTVSRGLE